MIYSDITSQNYQQKSRLDAKVTDIFSSEVVVIREEMIFRSIRLALFSIRKACCLYLAFEKRAGFI